MPKPAKPSWLEDPRGHPNRLDNRIARGLGGLAAAGLMLFLMWCVSKALEVPLAYTIGATYLMQVWREGFSKRPDPPKTPE